MVYGFVGILTGIKILWGCKNAYVDVFKRYKDRKVIEIYSVPNGFILVLWVYIFVSIVTIALCFCVGEIVVGVIGLCMIMFGGAVIRFGGIESTWGFGTYMVKMDNIVGSYTQAIRGSHKLLFSGNIETTVHSELGGSITRLVSEIFRALRSEECTDVGIGKIRCSHSMCWDYILTGRVLGGLCIVVLSAIMGYAVLALANSDYAVKSAG